jgi:phage terminase small subunit
MHLSKSAKAWWTSIETPWQLEAHNLEVLTLAAGCLDRITEARVALAKDGSITYDRHGMAKCHPSVLIERDQKSLFARLTRELNWSEPSEDSRPPRIRGRYEGRP